MPFPALEAAQVGAGILQSVIGGITARKNQKRLEALQSPTYTPNSSILQHYNEALARYGVSPTDTAMYKRQTRDINRGLATGINTLQDRRAGIAGASSLLRNYNDAMLNANAAAELEKSRRFNELGNAASRKAAEDMTAFQVNQMAPFERKYNLLAMKAGSANQTTNAGLQNIFGGLQNMSNSNLLSKYYKNSG